MKTILITGASGFIGSNFMERYKDKYNIIPMDLLKVKPEEIDFTRVDTVLHLAALVHQMKGAPREKYFEVNTELTRRVAVEAKKQGVKHFVFYSTVAVYGTHGEIYKEVILDKNSKINPKTPYAESKWQAEEILRKLEGDNFKISILRPPMVYGKNCPGNMRRLEKLVDILPILPFNYIENKRTLVEINKLLKITNEVIEKEVLGITIPKDDRDVSIKEIVEKIIKEKNKKRILIKFPSFIFKLLVKIKPEIMKSLYGDMRFE
ncbi:Cholesterol dehydrogenase [Fusobacterium necrogenes]|uniref:Cholesterol dehydrogenase n=1 Tax=Fusobacterium necrogenes TaxID=858 RepID=A0A377GZH1_9FUSO|nr:NAD-dependent epimerase/dehydratase family protein [Fusobacterium necrogenes]STO32263.1 Cholesterol dehydrogenase [Fusobacterium necrogenes]